METLWFILLWLMLATYVVLDGFDLGVGMLHHIVARNELERRQVIRSVGPVWDGNEVWLIAAGGTMFFAFPQLYASAFSGFYLPLMVLLWLLMGRALGIELRHQVDDPMWVAFWDAIFTISSTLLVIVLGAALGNVIRGVSFDASGGFFEPLWTDFDVASPTGILDWYTVLVAITAAAALMHHGAMWLFARTDGAVRERAVAVARPLWGATAVLFLAATVATFAIQPVIRQGLQARPWSVVFVLIAIAGLVAAGLARRRGRPLLAFRGSAISLYGLIASAAVGIHPFVLPSRDAASPGLTLHDVAAPAHGLSLALWWWVPGVALAIGYAAFVYRRVLPATVSIDDDDLH